MTVLLEATVDIKPIAARSLDHFIELYTTNEAPELDRHGYELVGAWRRSGGPLNRITHLYRFESLARYVDIRDSVRSDARFLALMPKYLEAPITLTEVITLGSTPAWYDDAKLSKALGESPAEPRQYVLAIVQIPMKGAAKAHELLARNVGHAEDAGGFQMVAAYEPVAGRRGELKVIGIFPMGLPPMAYQAGAPDPPDVEILREVVPEEEVYYLNPLPYSPLQ
jgi:hypothetical protein